MKHVHAETIIEFAKDMTKTVQVREKVPGGEWVEFPWVADTIAWLAGLGDAIESRIKPQPKAIGWTNVYKVGGTGRVHGSKESALSEAVSAVAYLLEHRDDGTAHLHKVEA